MSKKNSNDGGSPLGCLPLVVSILVLWALCFGVSYGGKHYNIACSCSRGVDITEGK